MYKFLLKIKYILYENIKRNGEMFYGSLFFDAANLYIEKIQVKYNETILGRADQCICDYI